MKTIERKYVIVVDVNAYTSGNHCAYQMQAIAEPIMRRQIRMSGMNLMRTKIRAALKSSAVFISYLAMVGKRVIVMSITIMLNTIMPSL